MIEVVIVSTNTIKSIIVHSRQRVQRQRAVHMPWPCQKWHRPVHTYSAVSIGDTGVRIHHHGNQFRSLLSNSNVNPYKLQVQSRSVTVDATTKSNGVWRPSIRVPSHGQKVFTASIYPFRRSLIILLSAPIQIYFCVTAFATAATRFRKCSWLTTTLPNAHPLHTGATTTNISFHRSMSGTANYDYVILVWFLSLKPISMFDAEPAFVGFARFVLIFSY